MRGHWEGLKAILSFNYTNKFACGNNTVIYQNYSSLRYIPREIVRENRALNAMVSLSPRRLSSNSLHMPAVRFTEQWATRKSPKYNLKKATKIKYQPSTVNFRPATFHHSYYNVIIPCILLPVRSRSWRRATMCDWKTDWLSVRSPLKELKYLFKYVFSFFRDDATLSSAIQHAMLPDFGGTLGMECFKTSFPLPTLLCTGYSMKLKKNILLFNWALNSSVYI